MHEYVIETERLILRPLCDKDRDASKKIGDAAIYV